jgi:hypothetical protein
MRVSSGLDFMGPPSIVALHAELFHADTAGRRRTSASTHDPRYSLPQHGQPFIDEQSAVPVSTISCLAQRRSP